MGILTMEHKGWELDIEYWGTQDEVMWAVERVAQAGHPDDYPNSNEIMKAVITLGYAT
jgi:hypothetical protein